LVVLMLASKKAYKADCHYYSTMDSTLRFQIYKWLKSQGYWVSYKDGTSDVSHLFLEGGKAAVPPEMTGAFNNAYAAMLARQEVMYVVEKKPQVFKLVFDLDMRVASPIEQGQVLELSTAVHQAVKEFYGMASCDMIVCNCEPKKGKGTQWKMGAHLVWPTISTITPDALRCRQHVLASPQVQAFAGLFENGMGDLIDKSVLAQNGVRMIGSHKLVACRCKGSLCDACHGQREGGGTGGLLAPLCGAGGCPGCGGDAHHGG
jgi:Prim-pol 4